MPMFGKEDEASEFETGKLLANDPRRGKRVLSLAHLPQATLYGTVKSVTRFSHGDAFLVQIRPGMHVNAEAENFLVLDKNALEWYPGDTVRYGKAQYGTVLRLLFLNGEIGILVQFDRQKVTLPPGALKRVDPNEYKK